MEKMSSLPIIRNFMSYMSYLTSIGCRKVIIDCDPGVDDMQAIIMALANKNINVLAITTVAGNGSADRVYKNTQKLLKFLKKPNIPVFHSSSVSMYGNIVQTDKYFGEDSMGEVDLIDNPCNKKKACSVEALNYYTRKYPGEITLVAMGPLTNLATAYLTDNELPTRLDRLFVLGGNRTEKIKFNVTPYAEFNAWCDPIAYNIVMKNFILQDNKKIVLVDFHFCQNHLLSTNFADEYYCFGSKFKQFLSAVMVNKTYKFMQSKLDSNGIVTADPFLIYLAANDDKDFKGTSCHLEKIVLEGEQVGRTLFKENSDGNIILVDEIDFERFKECMMDSLKC